MKNLNGIIIVFLLAFAVSTFVFVASLFSEGQKEEVKQYKVKVSELKLEQLNHLN